MYFVARKRPRTTVAFDDALGRDRDYDVPSHDHEMDLPFEGTSDPVASHQRDLARGVRSAHIIAGAPFRGSRLRYAEDSIQDGHERYG